jgi:hypothetical protein
MKRLTIPLPGHRRFEISFAAFERDDVLLSVSTLRMIVVSLGVYNIRRCREWGVSFEWKTRMRYPSYGDFLKKPKPVVPSSSTTPLTISPYYDKSASK